MIVEDKYEKEAEQRVPQDWLEGETREKPKKKARVKKFKQP